MAIPTVVAIIEFLVAEALSRAGEVDFRSRADLSAGASIFDELDSLAYEELADVYAVYLVGSGSEQDFSRALQLASTAGFQPIETMSQDLDLHVALSCGLEAYRRHHRFVNASAESSNG